MRWMIGAALLFLPALAAHAQEPVSAEGATLTVAGRVVADETGEPLRHPQIAEFFAERDDGNYRARDIDLN